MDHLHIDEAEAHSRIFGATLYQRSPLGRCWRDLGETAAHALALVTLSEFGQVAKGLMSTIEIAWSLSPRYYHRQLSVARATVNLLVQNDLVEMSGGGPIRYIAQGMTSTPQFTDEFLEYLHEADPIDPSETEELLKRL